MCSISSKNEASGILCTPPSSPPLLDTLFPELAGLEQNDALLPELSNLEQDDVFPSVLCASAGECALNTDGTLTEVSPIQSDSDQQPTNISGMHTLRARTGNRRYACDQDRCNRAFTQPGALTRHKRIHTGDRRYACDQDGCNKAFSTSSDLIRHKRIHTG
ncbi:C2H2-type zinc finger protein, partial [Sansalvadorimonas verongulae]|nr:C2H2-type zinc finger protein [Sansalvadorimonas verongulae]